jgi:hypothetical protein
MADHALGWDYPLPRRSQEESLCARAGAKMGPRYNFGAKNPEKTVALP